jgi:hypothetical protein
VSRELDCAAVCIVALTEAATKLTICSSTSWSVKPCSKNVSSLCACIFGEIVIS